MSMSMSMSMHMSMLDSPPPPIIRTAFPPKYISTISRVFRNEKENKQKPQKQKTQQQKNEQTNLYFYLLKAYYSTVKRKSHLRALQTNKQTIKQTIKQTNNQTNKQKQKQTEQPRSHSQPRASCLKRYATNKGIHNCTCSV